MKRKVSVAIFSCLMFVGLTFASATSAQPPHLEHPGPGGGGGGGYEPCTSFPCPMPT